MTRANQKELLVPQDADVTLPDGVKRAGAVEPLVEIRSKKDEDEAVKQALKVGRVFVKCTDWKIIPFENLVAKCRGKAKVIAVVASAEEGKVALEALELGLDGVLLDPCTKKELESLAKLVSGMDSARVELAEAEVKTVKSLGMGARACIDTCALMGSGEGMLIGSSSAGMLFVQCECEQNSLASPRPFRVNAGALSLYALAPENRTKYLEEMRAGDPVLVISRDGSTRQSFVGRSKIELRPLLLVEAVRDGMVAKAVLQNAETVRLVTAEGSKSVTELKAGDRILAHFERGGRHFGTHVKDEMVIEQ